MPNLEKIEFSISSASAYSKKNNDSILLNMMVHGEEAGGKSNHIIINTSGLEEIGSINETIYGLYEFKSVLYITTNTSLYSYNLSTKVLTRIGDISVGKKVLFSDNGIEMIFVASNGYFYNPDTNTLGSMVQDGWYPSDTVTYMDGYFIFNRTGTGQFFISKLFSHEIDPIDWATAESAPDDTVSVKVVNRQLWIIGERTSEVWYDSGDVDFPFTRISGAVSDIGCLNYKTVSKIRDNLLFTGDDFKVYISSGYSLKAISTSSIEFNIARADKADLNGFSFHEEGHWLYALHISDTLTYVYDIFTAQWHTRSSTDTNRWKINGAINISSDGTTIGFSNNNFYLLSIDNLTEEGNKIRREAVTLPINKGVNRFRIHEIQLDMEVGFSTEAKVILRLSDDGGITWSNDNYSSTGAIGKNRTRVRWNRLGQHRDAIVKIIITDPIPIRIIGLNARLS